MNNMYLYWTITHFLRYVQTNKRYLLLLAGLIFISTHIQSQSNYVFRNPTVSDGFIENSGQITDQNGMPNQDVLFLYPARGFNLQLRRDGFSYDIYSIDEKPATFRPSQTADFHDKFTVRFHRIDVRFVNANAKVKITADLGSAQRMNYYNIEGNNAGIAGVPVFDQVVYHELYPGIDLLFLKDGNGLKYNFIVKSGADPAQIKLKYSGMPSGGLQLQDEPAQALQIKLENGIFTETIPASWTEGVDGAKHPVKVKYRIFENGMVGFEVKHIIPSVGTLTIDPVPLYSGGTYYGGSNDDFGRHITADSSGNVYLSGYTYSLDRIATSGAYMSVFGGGSFDAFLAKFNAAGQRIWATYFGGSGNDDAMASAVDDSNNIYLAGYTRSASSIATAGAHQSSFGGGFIDGFLAKFDSNGQRKWATYYGGDGYDRCYSVISLQNNVIVTGRTQSTNNIATPGSYKPLPAGNDDAFIASFNPSGVRLWGSYYGGSGNDYGMSLAKDSKNNLYLAGHTNSVTDIASAKGFQALYGGGNIDAFLSKFGASGNFIWGTYIGGDQDDEGWSVTTGSDNSLYVTGYTNSSAGIATPNAYKDSLFGKDSLSVLNSDAFLIRISPEGSRKWSTYFGGDSSDAASSLSFSNNKIYLTGYTYSNSSIATAGSYSDTFNGVSDAFITGFDTSGYPYWSTYYGGAGYDEAFAVTSDRFNNIYLAGYTESKTKIADSNAFQDTFTGGTFDAFVARFRDPCFGYSAELLWYADAGCAGNNDGSAEISVRGGTAPYRYQWNTGDTGSVNMKLQAGRWFCSVNDFYGCYDTVLVVISEPAQLTAIPSLKDVSCSGGSDGWVVLKTDGGTQPYSYSWNTGDSLDHMNGLTAGKYSCIISDSNHCRDTISVEIGAPDKIVITALINKPACYGGTDGSLELLVSGGIMPYKYIWNSGDTASEINGLSAGKYECRVTDSNECSDSIAISLSQPDSIRINFDKADDNGSCNGSAIAYVSGGVDPYDYLWTPGSATDSAINNLCAGVYHLEITDSNNCKAEDSVIIELRVGIGNYSAEEGMILYPNPAEDYFQIFFRSELQISYDLAIYNTDGIEVLNKKVFGWDEHIDVSGLKSGIYLIKIISGEKVFSGLFMKQ